jgi:type VI secretion system secreted protein Hcp
MAVDIFLHFLPDVIKGETRDKVFGPLGGIDVLAYSWGMQQSGVFSSGGGGGAGKATLTDITITKYLDNATSFLQTCLAKGTHLKKAVLTVRKAGGTGPVDYTTITLEPVMVTSYHSGGSGGDDRLTETFTLAYGKINSHYFLQNDKGAVTSGPEFIWNVQTNTAT